MIGSSLKLKSTVGVRGKLVNRLKAISLINLSENKFSNFLREIESDPLFQRFFFPGDKLPRVIRRNPWPGTRLCSGFYEFKEETLTDTSSVNVEAILADHKDLVRIIKMIGLEAFERHFLYGEGARSYDEIARQTGLNLEEVKKIHQLVLEVSVGSQFSAQPTPSRAEGVTYNLIAQFETQSGVAPGVSFSVTTPYLARGRYSISKEALAEWKRQNALTPQEEKSSRVLLQKMELANMRQNTIFRILDSIAESQIKFIRSGKKFQMRPLTMRTLAKQLGLAPSTISRAVHRRCVKLPWGDEVPLVFLLSSQREVLNFILDDSLVNPGFNNLSDRVLAERVNKDYGIKVSRRSLNECRRKWRQRQ